MQIQINAVLIDDEPGNNENLANLLEKHCPQVFVMATATRVPQAIRLVEDLKPDLLFLDIQMGRENGFDLLKSVKRRDYEVIFITAHDQYGILAVKFSALDYLLKPVDIDELVAAVQKSEERITHRQSSSQLDALMDYLKQKDPKKSKIALPQQKEIRFVPVTDIVRCEASNTYTMVYLQNGEKILVSRLLKEYDRLLEPCGFIRTHQTHLVNPDYVKSWHKEDGGSLLMKDNHKIPISRPRREKVRLLLQEL